MLLPQVHQTYFHLVPIWLRWHLLPLSQKNLINSKAHNVQRANLIRRNLPKNLEYATTMGLNVIQKERRGWTEHLPNYTTQGRQNGTSSVHSLSVYNTVVVPCFKALLASGPGPSTSQPMSPGPQLLEYMSMLSSLWFKAKNSHASVDQMPESKRRTPETKESKISSTSSQWLNASNCNVDSFWHVWSSI